MIIFRKSNEVARDFEGQYEKGTEINSVAENSRSKIICLFPQTIFRVVIYLKMTASKVSPPTILASGIAPRAGNISAGLRKLRITNAVIPTMGLIRQAIDIIIDNTRAMTRTMLK